MYFCAAHSVVSLYTRLNSPVVNLKTSKESIPYLFTPEWLRVLWATVGAYSVTLLSSMVPANRQMPWAVIFTACPFLLILIYTFADRQPIDL